MSNQIWSYPETVGRLDVTGFRVEAVDGEIGKVDETSHNVEGAGYIVVDTGTWIFGKKVLLPAGVIDRVDREDEAVFVNRTKDEIEGAPEFDKDRQGDEAYRNEIGGYYDTARDDRADEPRTTSDE
jgi:hypothetical protein